MTPSPYRLSRIAESEVNMSEVFDLVKVAAKALSDKKGVDVKVLDIRGISPIADYFVIGSAKNANQIEAMQDAVDEEMHKVGAELKQIEGNRNSTWILMDYNDVIVHIFSEEDRLFYDLERVWTDGKPVDIEL